MRSHCHENVVFFLFSFKSKLIFTTEVLPLASFCRGEVLELGNGLFLSVSSPVFFSPDDTLIVRRLTSYIVPRIISLTKRCVLCMSLCGELLNQSTSHPASAGRNDCGTFLYQMRLRGVYGCGVVS